MHLLHGGNGRQEDVLCLLPGHGALFLQNGQQGLALDVVHDDVGGAVFVEAFQNPDDLGNVLHLDHLLGLPEEGVDAGLAQLLALDILRPLQIQTHGGIAAGLALGIVLLDGHLSLQIQIKADIGDAEAALAQHFPDYIVAVQHGSQGEGVAGGGRLPGVKAAMRTRVARRLLQTAQTTFKLHSIRLSFLFLHSVYHRKRRLTMKILEFFYAFRRKSGAAQMGRSRVPDWYTWCRGRPADQRMSSLLPDLLQRITPGPRPESASG